MELTYAINHLKESLADPTHKWGCEECKQEHEQLLEWLESYKTISESYPEVRKKIDRLEEENMRLLESALRLGKRCEVLESENNELKRLLRLAVDDLDKSIKACENDMLCEICSYEAECNCFNYCFIDKNLRSWKHHDEAMKLLGGTENA